MLKQPETGKSNNWTQSFTSFIFTDLFSNNFLFLWRLNKKIFLCRGWCYDQLLLFVFADYLSYVPITGTVRPDLVMANTLNTNSSHNRSDQTLHWRERNLEFCHPYFWDFQNFIFIEIKLKNYGKEFKTECLICFCSTFIWSIINDIWSQSFAFWVNIRGCFVTALHQIELYCFISPQPEGRECND